MCDIADEIVNFQSSIVVGVAREICRMHAEKTNYPINKLGILEKTELSELIALFTEMLELENTLYEVIKAHRFNIRVSSASYIELEKDQSNIIENQAVSRRAHNHNYKDDESNQLTDIPSNKISRFANRAANKVDDIQSLLNKQATDNRVPA